MGWDLEALVEIGLEHGVDFGDLFDKSEILAEYKGRAADLVTLLYDQIEFIEYANPVEEVRGRRSSVTLTDPSNPRLKYQATVRYLGKGMRMMRVGDKRQLFIAGQTYTFGAHQKELVDKLQFDKDFLVKWDKAVAEDSLVTMWRSFRASADSADYEENDEWF